MPKAKPSKKRGRPSDYSDAIADRICAELPYLDGGLEKLCEQPGMPHPVTVFRWLGEHEYFRNKYARARETMAEVQAQRGINDALTAKDAQLGRLRFDARKWLASKLAPKKYGERVEVENSGSQTIRVVIGGDA